MWTSRTLLSGVYQPMWSGRTYKHSQRTPRERGDAARTLLSGGKLHPNIFVFDRDRAADSRTQLMGGVGTPCEGKAEQNNNN